RRDQALGRRASLGRAHVDHDAPLAAVVEVERRIPVDLAPGRELEERSHRVARWRLDLHDVGAPIGEDPGRGRSRDPQSHFDDAAPVEHGGLQLLQWMRPDTVRSPRSSAQLESPAPIAYGRVPLDARPRSAARLTLAAIGALQGTAVWVLYERWPTTQP